MASPAQITDLQGEYCPVTPTDHILVQQLATLQTRFLRAQTHYLALIDHQAEDMYLDLKEKFVVDPDTDSRYAMAFEEQTQIEKEMPQPTKRQDYPAPDVDISLEEFNRAIIEAVERHGLQIPQEAKDQIIT